ncbi:RNA methyltransferase [Hoyosella rhizosphaerae]|uniref:TrmH family RNA methyltransferase n=1 Tax=Hoyosella rhizosphaerae TaxID=1755582 RepID=UPI001663C2A3|nr:RNA methyltransferase [Hoyosella rhizosphaerae]MBN4928189.1 RNA methyltransferase [Hoyosella rhizosphaerae]
MAYAIDITDPDDPRVDNFRNLTNADRRPDRPGGKGLVIGEGTIVVERMAGTRFSPTELLGVPRKLNELQAVLQDKNVPYFCASPEVMAKIVGFHLNRGVLAVSPRPAPLHYDSVLAGARTIAVLEGIGDHENLGALFRNAAALKVDGFLLGPRCSDPLYRRSVRVSMGHVLRIPYATIDDWGTALEALAKYDFHTVALTPQHPSDTLADTIAVPKVAFFLGAEGAGLSETALRAAHRRARIPMTPGVDSLNVATAGAIAFYERSRLTEQQAK